MTKEYDRGEFKAWLETLPPRQRFCERDGSTCPINQYMGIYGSVEALSLDRELAGIIDALDKVTYAGGWEKLYPEDVIEVIERMTNE